MIFLTLKNNPGYYHSNIPLTGLPILFGEKYAHVIIIIKPKAQEIIVNLRFQLILLAQLY